MLTTLPVDNVEQLFRAADQKWNETGPEDWLEAFSHHPKIGDLGSLQQKFANTSNWAQNEQSGVNGSTIDIIEALAAGNKAYEEKFGYIFIVCATGKSAAEMLDILQSRLPNVPETEMKIAAAEQHKITRIRLQKLLA